LPPPCAGPPGPWRFEAPSEQEAAAALGELGVSAQTALACVRLGLQDADRARDLAGAEGQSLRAAAERYARCAISGEMAEARPWAELLSAAPARGEAAGAELEAMAAAELELTARKDRKRVETEWSERIRRSRRRVQTGALDLGLQLVSLWFVDLACAAYGADELVRNCDRGAELEADAGIDPVRLRRAVELVEDTRERFLLNVSEDLACEALAYRLAQTLRR
jgi:DNA polymerase-3 subunit delta'